MKTAKLSIGRSGYERPVLVQLARGYRPKQIAAALGLTTNQVCQIRRRILDRNGITNDVQLGMLIERDQFVSVIERNLIEDRRDARMAEQQSAAT